MTGEADECGGRAAPQAEFALRLARVQEAMAERRIAVLVLTAQDNFVYLTGFDSPTWVNLARPRYCVVPARGDLVLVVPTTNVSAVERMTWVKDIRSWVSPNPADDGLSLVVDAVRASAEPDSIVGMEIGPQSRLGMPACDFVSLRERLLPRRLADADSLLREIRKVKSPFEISAIRRAAAATSRAFDRLPGCLQRGRDDRSIVRDFHALLAAEGVDDAPYLVAEGGVGGYPSLQMGPSGWSLEAGAIWAIDAGCRVRGYFCDFNRNFGCGRIPEISRRVDALLWQATEAGIDAAVPGATAADVWQAMARILDRGLEEIGARRTRSGRMGHGIGLRLTEPPSIHPDDATVLAPGMVITVEPAAEFDVATPAGSLRRMLIHEENLVVTANGPELLSQRAARGMTMIP
jgi:Xaa-Pro dipeptidase